MPPTGPRRLLDLFPPGFDVHSKSTSKRRHYQFPAEVLYRRLTEEYNPEKHVESTTVKSVWYGKHRKSVRHEFILIEVEETCTRLVNYLVLDRNLKETTSTEGDTLTSQLASSSSSCRGGAVDDFRVSYDGVEESLLRECHLWPRDYLEKIHFSASDPLYLYQLVTLVQVVSESRPTYAVEKHNCYWFAGLIWNCLRSLRATARYDDRRAKQRGRLAILRYTPETRERDRLCAVFQETVGEVDKRLSDSREEWIHLQSLREQKSLAADPKLRAHSS